MSQERDRSTGTLFVVSTPIGNLGDITLRALEVLRGVPLVAAEDTRHTRRIWARHGIETPLVSYHAQNASGREPELLAHLAGGSDLALVTDAGTPIVSDPGEGIVASWAERGGTVVPIPGASSVLAALVASGIAAPRWGFEGFLPRRGAERRERLARVANDDRATVLFEAPGRTAATVRDLRDACGEGRRAAVCRELTKLHEEILRGTLGELTERLVETGARGEVTIVVAGRGEGGEVASLSGNDAAEAPVTIEEGRARVAALIADGMPRAAAAKQVSRETGLARRELFLD